MPSNVILNGQLLVSQGKPPVYFDGSNCYMRISNFQGWLYTFMCNKVLLSNFQLSAR